MYAIVRIECFRTEGKSFQGEVETKIFDFNC